MRRSAFPRRRGHEINFVVQGGCGPKELIVKFGMTHDVEQRG
jgi:hypothetical protein